MLDQGQRVQPRPRVCNGGPWQSLLCSSRAALKAGTWNATDPGITPCVCVSCWPQVVQDRPGPGGHVAQPARHKPTLTAGRAVPGPSSSTQEPAGFWANVVRLVQAPSTGLVQLHLLSPGVTKASANVLSGHEGSLRGEGPNRVPRATKPGPTRRPPAQNPRCGLWASPQNLRGPRALS